jgi:DNA-binding GntR family transcriptional regulator
MSREPREAFLGDLSNRSFVNNATEFVYKFASRRYRAASLWIGPSWLEQERSKSSMSARADHIHDRILGAIVEHALPPGTKLGEEQLCEIFGVGRGVIRRTLLRLAGDQVIELVPHRGAFVAEPSVEQARQVFAARRVLEAAVVREIARAGLQRDQIAQLRRHLARERTAHAQGKRGAVIRLSGALHLLLADLAGNLVIARFLGELVARTSLIIAIYEAPAISCCPYDEHAALIEAIIDGRGEAAMRAHLESIEARLRLDRTPAPAAVDLRQALAARPPAAARALAAR